VAIHILALEKDLFFRVKIQDTLAHYDMQVKAVRSLPQFTQGLAETSAQRPALVIVNISTPDLDWEEAIRQAHAQHYPVLAFGSHMDLEARQKALQAGAQRVVANSRFARAMPDIVKQVLAAPTTVLAQEEDEE
jgi:DNA-binding NarL/FixJ family response regulator